MALHKHTPEQRKKIFAQRKRAMKGRMKKNKRK